MEEGAAVNARDRWGATPLQDAVNANHGHVIELLQRNGAKLAYEDPAGMLCAAAVAGRGLHPSTSQLNLSRFCHLKCTLTTPSSTP